MILEIYDIERKNWIAIRADQIRSISVQPSKLTTKYEIVIQFTDGSTIDKPIIIAETENHAREVYEKAHDALVDTCPYIQGKQKNRRDLKCLSDEEIQRIMNPKLPTMIPGDDRDSDPADGDDSFYQLDVDFSKDPYREWAVYKYQNYIGVAFRSDVCLNISPETYADAEHIIKAHQMQWRLAQIEKAAMEKWGVFITEFSEKSLKWGDIGKKANEMFRLMGGRENFELGLRGPWRK